MSFEPPDGNPWRRFYKGVAIVYLIYPLAVLISGPFDALTAVLAISAVLLFAGLIGIGARLGSSAPIRTGWLGPLAVIGLTVIASVLVLRDPNSGWSGLFYFASAGASPLIPVRRAVVLMTIAGAAAGLVLYWISGDPAAAAVQGLSVALVGAMILSINALRRTNQALLAARAELAGLAVAEERARIARDLHDTLGHTLTLIALKSELAGRLLPDDPERAQREIADVEHAAREALASVRETVSGSRRPTLDAELDAARRALAAASIGVQVDSPADPLPEPVDAVLAWTVREAVTNVIRHSRAREVAIRVVADGAWASARVDDDGHGADPSGTTAAERGTSGGTGLAGLSERIAALGGTLEAGARTGGGYRLEVRLPLGDGATRAAARP